MTAPTPCPTCHAPRETTRDALGRPIRETCRCRPASVAHAAQPTVYVDQTAPSSRDLHRLPKGTCKTCGIRLVPDQRPGRRGRQREYCEAHTTRSTRWYERTRAVTATPALVSPVRAMLDDLFADADAPDGAA